MAYIVNTTDTTLATAASYTVTLGTHQTGDLLMVFLTQDVGGTSIAPDATATTAGWAMLVQERSSTIVRHAVAWVIATSSSMTSPTFTGSNDDWIGCCIVVRDAHASPFGSIVDGTDYNSTAYTSASSYTSGALTTGAAGALVFYSYGIDGPGSPLYARAKINDYRCATKQTYGNSAITQTVGYLQQESAGAVPSNVTYLTSARVATGIVCAVRNVASGSLQPDIRPSVDEFFWYGDLGATKDGAITFAALNTFAASVGSISGNAINCSATGPTVTASNNVADAKNAWGTATALGSTENATLLESASGVGIWVGGGHTFAAKDMSGKLFAATFSRSSSSDTSTATEGVVLFFTDGTNWAAYQVQSKLNGWTFNSFYTSFVALGNATLYASSGSINWSAVTGLAWLVHRTTASTANLVLQIKNVALFDAVSITGGGSSRPATFADFQKAIVNWATYAQAMGNPYSHADLQGSGQVLAKHSVQIGDGGSNTTYFDASASSFEYPSAFSTTATGNMLWNAGSASATLSVKAGASDTINLAACAAATDVAENLTIDSASSTSAAYSFSGASFVGWTPTWKTGVNVSSATFKECAEIDAKGSDWTDCTIAKTTSTDAAIAFSEDGGTMTRCTIDVTGTSAAYHLELGTATTAITLTDVTFTGTPTTDKVHVRKTTGTVTITISGTTTLAAGDVTSDGATVVISGPTINQVAIASGFTAGSRIQIYDVTSATELFNGTASSGATVVSGSTATWTDPSAAVASRAIRIRVAYVSGTTAEVWQEFTGLTCGTTSGTESVTYPITPESDTTYNSNGINGPAIYATSGITFTDAATDLVNISIAGGTVTWPTIYACFVYWLSTAAGIDDDVAYISAPDPANYLLTSMKLKNTHANPLTVTGGYGRSATTGLVADIIDTAGSTGNIFPSPDHVVAYATGSGSLTAGDITNIWSNSTRTITTTIPTAAQVSAQVLADATTTPIAANIKEVNDITVDGNGQDATPWGPTV